MSNSNLGYWLRRRPAAAFFKFAAMMTLGLVVLFGVLLAVYFAKGDAAVSSYTKTVWIQVVGFCIGAVGAPCALLLWAGMLLHSVSAKKIGWLVPLIFGNWLVALLYYVFSYSRQPLVHTDA